MILARSSPEVDFKPSGDDIDNAWELKLANPQAKSYLYMPKNPIVKEIELK